MDRYYQPSSIRIYDSNHRPVGTGIYVGDHLILTCEHVVARAQDRTRAQEDGLVPFGFAYDERPPGAPKPSARVLKLWPEHVVRCFGQLYDVALLWINEPETIPPLAAAAPLSDMPDAPNQEGQVFGFASHAGQSVAVRCGLQLTDTLVELFFDESQAPVAGGHSGSPVWSTTRQVIGMVIERDEASGNNTPPKAYMLPAAQFEFALTGFRSSVSSAHGITGSTEEPSESAVRGSMQRNHRLEPSIPNNEVPPQQALRELLEELPIWDDRADRIAFLKAALGHKHPALMHSQLDGKQFSVAIQLSENLLRFDLARLEDGSHGICGLLREVHRLGWDQVSEVAELMRFLAQAFDCLE